MVFDLDELLALEPTTVPRDIPSRIILIGGPSSFSKNPIIAIKGMGDYIRNLRNGCFMRGQCQNCLWYYTTCENHIFVDKYHPLHFRPIRGSIIRDDGIEIKPLEEAIKCGEKYY